MNYFRLLTVSLCAVFSSLSVSLAEDPFMTFDPPLEVSVFKTADTFFGYTDEQTPSDNDLYREVDNIVGIKFVNKAEVSTSAFPEKVRLAITSNDLPDWVAASTQDYATMIDNDMLVDLKPYIDAYMSPALQQATNEFNGVMYAPATRDGKIYGIPGTETIQNRLRVVWIRKDWLANLDRELPTTMEELLDLARAFALEDPDQNGQQDTYGLAFADDVLGLVNPFEVVANAYGYYPGHIIKGADGTATYGSLDPGLKDILQIFQDFYKEGVIDPEFATKDFQKVDESLAAGKLGLWIGVFWKPVDPGMASTYQSGVEWATIPVPPSEKTGVYEPYVEVPVNVWYGVRKGYEHPESLVVLLNHLYTVSTDAAAAFAKGYRAVQAKHSTTGVNNWLPVQLQNPVGFECSPLKKALADPDFDPVNPAYTVHLGAYDVLRADSTADEVNKKQFSDIFLGAVCAMETYDVSKFVTSAYSGAPTRTQQQKGSILEDLEDEIFATIISGRKPVSDYDGFIEQYRKLGGDQILEEINTLLGTSN